MTQTTDALDIVSVAVRCSRWTATFRCNNTSLTVMDIPQHTTAFELCRLLQGRNPFPTDREVEVIDVTFRG